MKIRKNTLIKIIKEELANLLSEEPVLPQQGREGLSAEEEKKNQAAGYRKRMTDLQKKIQDAEVRDLSARGMLHGYDAKKHGPVAGWLKKQGKTYPDGLKRQLAKDYKILAQLKKVVARAEKGAEAGRNLARAATVQANEPGRGAGGALGSTAASEEAATARASRVAAKQAAPEKTSDVAAAEERFAQSERDAAAKEKEAAAAEPSPEEPQAAAQEPAGSAEEKPADEAPGVPKPDPVADVELKTTDQGPVAQMPAAEPEETAVASGPGSRATPGAQPEAAPEAQPKAAAAPAQQPIPEIKPGMPRKKVVAIMKQALEPRGLYLGKGRAKWSKIQKGDPLWDFRMQFRKWYKARMANESKEYDRMKLIAGIKKENNK